LRTGGRDITEIQERNLCTKNQQTNKKKIATGQPRVLGVGGNW